MYVWKKAYNFVLDVSLIHWTNVHVQNTDIHFLIIILVKSKICYTLLEH